MMESSLEKMAPCYIECGLIRTKSSSMGRIFLVFLLNCFFFEYILRETQEDNVLQKQSYQISNIKRTNVLGQTPDKLVLLVPQTD